MIFSLTGTPGTGKTSIAEQLKIQDITIVDVNDFAITHDCVIEYDHERDTQIIDMEKLNIQICKEQYEQKLICIEGHLSHLLQCIEKVIVLRCHPKELLSRLQKKGWNRTKIQENLDAEMLDIILCESINQHDESNTYEIDTTNSNPIQCSSIIIDLIRHGFKNDTRVSPGKVDWSEYITENLFED
jgi:adenylate kinase